MTMANKNEVSSHLLKGPGLYRIRVHGRLDATWSDQLGGLRITTAGGVGIEDETTLEGKVADQAALTGILNTLCELQMPVLHVERLVD